MKKNKNKYNDANQNFEINSPNYVCFRSFNILLNKLKK